MARFRVDNYVVAQAPRLGWRGWARWVWRQVTSMRVALILLLALALAAIPGSVLPQWPQDAAATRAFVQEHAFWGPVLDGAGFLDVFGSAWFTAIYVLLFASLIGCIIPRAAHHWREIRRPIAAAPTRVDRFDPTSPVEVPGTAADALGRVRAVLPARGGLGYRVRIDERDGEIALAAEAGHVREWGNLVFHTALVGVLIAVAVGTLFTYRGQAIVVEGRSFTNAVVAYDTFDAGQAFDPAALGPFTLRLDALDANFDSAGRPLSFAAQVTVTEPRDGATGDGVGGGTGDGVTGDGASRETEISVNHPLEVAGATVYLQGNGYAPVITVRDSAGEVAFSGAVPFLPQDAAYTSTGVVKVPDVSTGPQLGLSATLYPTYLEGPFAVASVHPDPGNPVIVFTAYEGDLGLDSGVPQNVYQLDQSQLSPVRGDDGQPVTLALGLGETVTLPGDLGTVTFEALPRFAAFDLRADPTLPWLLAAAVLSLAGLATSLFAPRRKVWVVAKEMGGTTVVTGAGLAPVADSGLAHVITTALAAAAGVTGDEPPRAGGVQVGKSQDITPEGTALRDKEQQ